MVERYEVSEVSFDNLKVSSRTLHIAWDDAGCLCPIGDLFNYAAPNDDNSSTDEDRDDMMHQETNKMLDQTDFDSSEKLTDGGYEDVNEYRLYARKRYRKGEQVSSDICLKYMPFFVYRMLMFSRITLSAFLLFCTFELNFVLSYRYFWLMERIQTWNFLSIMVFFWVRTLMKKSTFH